MLHISISFTVADVYLADSAQVPRAQAKYTTDSTQVPRVHVQVQQGSSIDLKFPSTTAIQKCVKLRIFSCPGQLNR